MITEEDKAYSLYCYTEYVLPFIFQSDFFFLTCKNKNGTTQPNTLRKHYFLVELNSTG